MSDTKTNIDVKRILEFMKEHPDVNPPCKDVQCPIFHTFQEHPEWMYVPWKPQDVNPHCRDSGCPWYDEAMK